MKSNLTFYILVIFLVFIGCNKDKGPYYTNAEGKVYKKQDSTLIPNCILKIYNWDGDKKHDTIVLHEFRGDSTGYFKIDFEVKDYTEFFFIEASIENYENSELIQIDGNSTNYLSIYLNNFDK